MGNKSRISTDGGDSLGQNPFDALGGLGDLPAGPVPETPQPASTSKRREPNRNRGRIEIRRLTGGKGGKTVTGISGFQGIAAAELRDLAKHMQKRCGTGGTVKGNQIEIQGDQREAVTAILADAGFRPVMAGG